MLATNAPSTLWLTILAVVAVGLLLLAAFRVAEEKRVLFFPAGVAVFAFAYFWIQLANR